MYGVLKIFQRPAQQGLRDIGCSNPIDFAFCPPATFNPVTHLRCLKEMIKCENIICPGHLAIFSCTQALCCRVRHTSGF